MPKRIESITLEFFKGATNKATIDFDTSKPVVIIFGENGTGKSTIVDAIDFVCNEEFGSIDQRSTTGSKADLLSSFGCPASNLKVTANYAGNDWTGIIGHGKKPVSSGSGDRPTVKILRRSEILKIVDGQPTARYEALKSFINVPKAENNENALRTAVNDTDRNYNSAVIAYQQAEQSLKEAWEAEGKPDGDYKKWAQSKSEIDATSLTRSSSYLNSILQKMNDCESALKSLSSAETAYKATEKSFREADQKYNAIKESIEGIEKDIVDVLEKAKDFLTKHPSVTSCPVCEKPGDPKELAEKIDKRLATLKNLVTAKKAYKSAKEQTVDAPSYEKPIIKPFTTIEEHNFEKYTKDSIHHFRDTITPTNAIPAKVFSGFRKACHDKYKFDTKTEKDFAIILEDDVAVTKWLRPSRRQFKIYWDKNSRQYHPDFVAETKDAIYLIETKKEGDMKTSEVQEKAAAALEYCKHATEFNISNGKKPWKYVLIPHNAVLANMSLEHLTKSYEIREWPR
jgi:energy-coupling factor transporter ATP-binding protein EcfA2